MSVLVPDDLAFLLRIDDASQSLQESLLRLDVNKVHAEVLPEGLHNLMGLVLAKEPVVHEDARELLAHRPVDQGGRDGRVHPSAQSADDLA